MEEKKEKEESLTKQLYHFAGSYKYLSILSTILAAISAFVALVPFYYIWKVMQEVLRVRFDFSKAAGISTYGWRAVGFAILGMIIYMAGLMCSHIAAFHVQAQMRTAMMNHIMTLPLGYIESEGTGKIRKIVTDSSAATETYLAHTLPDKAEGKLTSCYQLTNNENLMFLYEKYYYGEESESEELNDSEVEETYMPLVFNTEIETEYERNRIVFGAPGTGKSYELKEDCEDLLKDAKDNYERVTFHPDYSYSQFVGTYKPVMGADEKIRYDFVPGPFMRVYVEALKSGRTENPQPHLLLIEEINRAKVAAVFGDVFQLLDRDDDGVSEYEIQASEDIRKYLAKQLGGTPDNYQKIRIPNNMFIWSTMNSADQGVFPMDTAFKRRWNFEYLGINENEEKISGIGKIELAGSDEPVEWNILRRAINAKMSSEQFKINEDKLMGPFFLSKKIIASDENGMIIDTDKFVAAFKSKVIMYLYEDAVKQGKHRFFDGCDNSKYSSVCDAFDELGMGIFGPNFKENFYDKQRDEI